MKILDFAWVSWVLILAGLITAGAWLGLGIWWLRLKKIRKIKKLAPNQDINSQQSLLRETESLFVLNKIRENYPQVTKPLAFSENPEKIMWRPPPRESLLHRQQVKNKLGRPEDRLDGQRQRLTKSQSNTVFPAFPTPPQVTAVKKNAPPVIRIASTDSKIGRKRQGLESLVNLSPPEELENNHDARNS